MAAEEGNIIRGVFTGEEEPEEFWDEDGNLLESILLNITHLSVHESITVIPGEALFYHPNIVELICHNGVKKIEYEAFDICPRLKRLVMPGVEEVEWGAFNQCEAVEHIECKKLEIIRQWAFSHCKSLESIDLPSAMIVKKRAFGNCTSLMDVKFGKNLESIEELAFSNSGLKRITIPLKSGLFTSDDVFQGCKNLDEVCLIEEAIIQEIVDAFLWDEWKSDMNKEIDSINQILPNADINDDYNFHYEEDCVGEKTKAIREWIGRVLQKIIHYKVEHYRLLSLAAAALAHASPNEIVIDSVLSFLQLPDHAFEGEGDSGTTTPALDRQLWGNVVQMEQRLLEKDTEIASLRSKCLVEKDMEITLLKAKNDEQEDEIHQQGDEIHQLKLRLAQFELQVADSGEAIEKNDADGLSQKRPMGS